MRRDDEYERDLGAVAGRIRDLDPPDLAARFARHFSLDAGSFRTVRPIREGVVAAVDGSHAMVLEAGSFSVAAIRAGASGFSRGERIFRSLTPLRLVTLGCEARDRSFSDLYRGCFGTDPETTVEDDEPERAVSVMRDTLEYWVALRAAERLGQGDLLALDGALRITHASHEPVMVRILQACAVRRVHLAAVTKRTTLTWGGGLPVVPAARSLAGMLSIPPPWFLPLDEERLDLTSYRHGRHGSPCIVALHPRSRHAFKIEVPRAAGEASVERTVSLLAGWADDGRVTGYPYPLFDAHRAVRIRTDIARLVENDLMARMGDAGFESGRFRELFGDIHDEFARY